MMKKKLVFMLVAMLACLLLSFAVSAEEVLPEPIEGLP